MLVISLFCTGTIVAPVHSDVYETQQQHQEQKNDSNSLRICSHCMGMIECRRQAQYNQTEQPLLCKLYYKLQKMKAQLQPSIDLYYKVSVNLNFNQYSICVKYVTDPKRNICKLLIDNFRCIRR